MSGIIGISVGLVHISRLWYPGLFKPTALRLQESYGSGDTVVEATTVHLQISLKSLEGMTLITLGMCKEASSK